MPASVATPRRQLAEARRSADERSAIDAIITPLGLGSQIPRSVGPLDRRACAPSCGSRSLISLLHHVRLLPGSPACDPERGRLPWQQAVRGQRRSRAPCREPWARRTRRSVDPPPHVVGSNRRPDAPGDLDVTALRRRATRFRVGTSMSPAAPKDLSCADSAQG